jgi:hypothetical protein
MSPERIRVSKIKFQCHRLMNDIWGSNKRGRALAYNFVHKQIGIIHFADESDFGILFRARRLLEEEALRRELLTISDL